MRSIDWYQKFLISCLADRYWTVFVLRRSKSIENLLKIHRKSIENLLKIYWTSNENLLNIHWKSNENLLKMNWKSIENRSKIYWKSIENLLKIYWKSIANLWPLHVIEHKICYRTVPSRASGTPCGSVLGRFCVFVLLEGGGVTMFGNLLKIYWKSIPSSPVQSRPVPSGPVQSRPVPSRPVQSRPVPSSPVQSGLSWKRKIRGE